MLLLVVLLAGCDRATPAPLPSAGTTLERAARSAGLVPSTADPTGLYASETDRVCVVRAGGGYRVGVTSAFADGQGCSASGTATGGVALSVRLNEGCAFTARFDGEGLRFPAVLPAACDATCRGRATLAALTAERLSGSVAEAAAMRDRAGAQPCAT